MKKIIKKKTTKKKWKRYLWSPGRYEFDEGLPNQDFETGSEEEEAEEDEASDEAQTFDEHMLDDTEFDLNYEQEGKEEGKIKPAEGTVTSSDRSKNLRASFVP